MEPPRCGVCTIFGQDNLSCPKRVVDKPKKQHTNYDGFQLPPRHTSRGTNAGSKVQYKPEKQVYQYVLKKNGVSPSGSKKYHETNSANLINELKIQMLDGKLVLVGDDGKPLKPCRSMFPSSSNVASKKVDDPVNEDSSDEMLEVYNETAAFIDSTSSNVNEASKSGSRVGHKIFYEQ
nr:hypothetical protein [Tanacetum cinerariifolium]